MKHPSIASTTLAVASLLAVFSTSHLRSGEMAPVASPAPVVMEDSSGWEFTIAPYLLMAGVDGSFEVGPFSGDFDKGFSDILDNLDAGFILAAQARYNRFSLLADFIYLGLSTSGDADRQFYEDAKLSLDTILFTAIAAYRVHECESSFIDIGVGGRVLWVDSDLNLRDRQGRLPSIDVGDDSTNADALVALRLGYNVGEKWKIRLYGDVGAGDSDLTWQVSANLGYAFCERATLFGGYRHIGYEWDGDRASADIAFSGPQIGLAIHF